MKLTDIRFGNGRHATAYLAIALAGCVAVAGAAHATIFNLSASIDGSQEVPPVATPASGSASMVMDTDANTLDFNIQFANLIGSETAAHFHGPAAPGVNAGVIFPLPLGSPKIGTWNMTDAQEQMVLDGLVYINIHSSFRPGGEIRGQVGLAVNATETSSWGKIKALYQ